jgi:hypothetical protein
MVPIKAPALDPTVCHIQITTWDCCCSPTLNSIILSLMLYFTKFLPYGVTTVSRDVNASVTSAFKKITLDGIIALYE